MKSHSNIHSSGIESNLIDYIFPEPAYHFLGLNYAGSSLQNVNLSTYNVKYPFVTELERNFDYNLAIRIWNNYAWLAYPILAGYFLMILGLQRFMKNRQAYNLKYPLFMWNLGWAVLTTIGLTRSFPEIWFMLKNYGLTSAICLSKEDAFTKEGVLAVWGLIFVFSKAGEFGDTVFLLLRKRKLIFLHWYHHATVFFQCWTTFGLRVSTARLCAGMNGFVHSLMYTYYAIAALGIKIPRRIAMMITCVQISQMVIGVTIHIWAYLVKKAGNECGISYYNINAVLIMYFSYVVLFSNFFVQAYMKEFSPKMDKQAKLKNNNEVKVKTT